MQGSMSFKKPFRAVPITFGAGYARQQQREKHIALAKRLALVIGVPVVASIGYWAVGPHDVEPTLPMAVAETEMTEFEIPQPVRYTRPMSAAELDAQQPGGLSSALPSPAKSARSIPTASGASWSYPNCGAARAAGAAPIYQGQPGYGLHMDGDRDGIACEPIHRP
jgi:hypothetical protein